MKALGVYRKKTCVCQRNCRKDEPVLWQWVYFHILRGGVKERKHISCEWPFAGAELRQELVPRPRVCCDTHVWQIRVRGCAAALSPPCPGHLLVAAATPALPWASADVLCPGL